MKMRFLIPVVLLSSIFGGVVGAILVSEIFLHRTRDVVRTQRIQIEDAHGAVKATLAAEQDGSVFLRFLSSDDYQSIRLGEQVHDAQSNARASTTPVLEFNTKDGGTAFRISTDREDNGVVAFSDRKRENTILLGHFPFPTDFGPNTPKYEWGLNIGREHGETGIGIVDREGLPVDYISPVTHSKKTASPTPIRAE